RKDVCSNRCHAGELIPSSNNVGICHPIKVAQAASQANLGRSRSLPNVRPPRDFHNGTRKLSTNRCGKLCNIERSGAPSQIRGGASVIKSRCCSIWTVSNSWSSAAIGDAIATQIKNSPSRKLTGRQAELAFTKVERRDSHPRR